MAPDPEPLFNRDPRTGRFVAHNLASYQGGRARAERLSPQRRRAIASMGFAAFVAKRFGGDRQAAVRWLGQLGAWAVEEAAYRNCPQIYKPGYWPHPGPCPHSDQKTRNQ